MKKQKVKKKMNVYLYMVYVNFWFQMYIFQLP